MNPLAIRGLILLAGAAAAFGAGWVVNGWRLGEQIAQIERDQVAAVAAAHEAARLKERAMAKQAEEARNAATQREIALRRAADGARGALDGLLHDIADLRRAMPGMADEAIRQRADTLGELFAECTARYTGVAEKALRHANDVRMMIEAWPE